LPFCKKINDLKKQRSQQWITLLFHLSNVSFPIELLNISISFTFFPAYYSQILLEFKIWKHNKICKNVVLSHCSLLRMAYFLPDSIGCGKMVLDLGNTQLHQIFIFKLSLLALITKKPQQHRVAVAFGFKRWKKSKKDLNYWWSCK
jgi:hypothetical protein